MGLTPWPQTAWRRWAFPARRTSTPGRRQLAKADWDCITVHGSRDREETNDNMGFARGPGNRRGRRA